MIQVVKRLVCDWCGRPGPEGRAVADTRALAGQDGWARLWLGGDEYHVCPACQRGETAVATPPRGAWVLPVLGRLMGRVTVPAMDTGRVVREPARRWTMAHQGGRRV